MHNDELDSMGLDRIGRQLFGLLICLLRPVVRTMRGAWVAGAQEQALRAPVQQGTVTVEPSHAGVLVDVTQIFANPYDEPLHLSATFPLPCGSAVYGMNLHQLTGAAVADIYERSLGRTQFDIARCTNRTAVLVCEDGDGVFTQEIAALALDRSVRVTLRYAYPFAAHQRDGQRRTRLVLRFDAAPPLRDPAAAQAPRRVLRLG